MNNLDLRVCLTEECNFNCKYCRPGGEGIFSNNKMLEEYELYRIIENLTEFGVKSVRFTGGEPLLRKNFIQIAKCVSDISNIESVSLVTNGSLLSEEMVAKIREIGIKEVTVSLDTLDKSKFKGIVRVDCFDKVVNGIKLLRKYSIPTRINTVITKSNISEVHEFIEYCNEYGINLKLLDLVNNDADYWASEFIPLEKLRKELSEIATMVDVKYPNSNNLGTPMDRFKIGSIDVSVKDNTIGTCYSNICNECEHYPCQSGIVSLVLTHDGFLKLCSSSSKNSINIKPLINKDLRTIEKLKEMLNCYNNTFYKNVWYKTIDREKVK
ncbi:radical SAM protein [Clostridium tertium]|uniref:radical SAM protein n=1 Tax=Clostridium tertium TaxID=1559 RepID=UPI0024B36EE0|nr:radical SAM protein [Clostridium tertium]MDI9216413.1 radical SAM protein [Clostridium tertium]